MSILTLYLYKNIFHVWIIGFLHAYDYTQLLRLSGKHGLYTAVQLIRFEQAGRQAVHQLSKSLSIPCALDTDIKLCRLFTKQDTSDTGPSGLRQNLGVFYPFRSWLKYFGVDVRDSSEQLSNVLNVTSDTLGSAILLDRGCDSFWPAKFVLGRNTLMSRTYSLCVFEISTDSLYTYIVSLFCF